MLFNSYIFWVFFAVVFALYRVLPHRKQNLMLLAASYLFYGYWDWRFLFVMLYSTVIDYYAAIAIGREGQTKRRRKLILVTSMCVQLGLLALFKYYAFFSTEVVAVLARFGVPVSLPTLNLLLPVGISFYTFQTMSYTIDVYRGQFKPSKSFTEFALFVSFFPHLVAGPLVRATKLLPQITNARVRRPEDFREGLYLVLTGLFKKVVVGDNLAAIANSIFNTPTSELSGMECLVGVYAFAFQIYGDFSGYSSIAQGVARWLNIDLSINFRMPYLATSPSDFWNRWHISLSTWFRDYVYVPLARRGGGRVTKARLYSTQVIVMLLSGLWHGAAWTFVLWGLYHGLLLAGYRFYTETKQRILRKRRAADGAPPAAATGGATTAATANATEEGSTLAGRLVAMFLMFHLVCLGWLLFRAESVGQAWGMLARMFMDFRFTSFGVSCLALVLFYAAPLMIYEFWLDRREDLLELTRVRWLTRGLAYTYCALMLWFFPPPVSNVFIYFQF
ncbi:MAG TPA: MBOAT family O-acyltransferase [Pyrinomonadaceae bacterium]|nr:MBOAT family O-acyltransferase [Pyrinomonadaceae bacterium]